MVNPSTTTLPTYAAFVATERASEVKHEYHAGQIYAMAGGSLEHGRLAMSISRLLGNALAGRPCVVLSSDVRIRIEAADRALYPDLSVVGGMATHPLEDPDAIVNPKLVVEVLSDTSEAYDRGEKFGLYRLLPSLETYLLVSQKRPLLEAFQKQQEHWVLQDAATGGTLSLASLEVDLDVDEVYRNPLTA